jgi:MYXO-CTERM domain-containing protein
MKYLCGLFVSLAVWTGAPIVGNACLYAPPSMSERLVWPTANVATNPRLLITYVGWYDPSGAASTLGPDLVLLDADGKVVPVATQAVNDREVFLRPVSPLLPGATYRLADGRAVPCDGSACAAGVERAPFASFTTSGSSDAQAPAFAGVKVMRVDDFTESQTSCGGSSGHEVRMGWDRAQDDRAGPDVRYNIQRRAPGSSTWETALSLSEDLVYRTFINCTNGIGSRATADAPLGDYRVRAVDGSGNEDDNAVVLTLSDPCPLLPVAAPAAMMPGSQPAPPAAPSAPAATSDPVVSGGCALGPQSTAPTTATFLAAVGLTALLARRRRRR